MQMYQPPQSYMDKYKDPTVFNNEYEKYVQHLAQENEDDGSQNEITTLPPKGEFSIHDTQWYMVIAS